MAKGRCERCYDRWRYGENVDGARDRHNASAKRYRLDPKYDEKQAVRIARYNSDPEKVDRHRALRSEWARRNSPWPIGSRVFVCIADLAVWSETGKRPRNPVRTGPKIVGTLIAKPSNVVFTIRFATFTEDVPIRRLFRE